MERDELIKKMIEEISKNVPAKITIETDKNGETHASMEGRGIDLLRLSLTISNSIIKKLPLMTVNKYYELLKDMSEKEENEENLSKEERDVRNELRKEFMEFLKNK